MIEIEVAQDLERQVDILGLRLEAISSQLFNSNKIREEIQNETKRLF